MLSKATLLHVVHEGVVGLEEGRQLSTNGVFHQLGVDRGERDWSVVG